MKRNFIFLYMLKIGVDLFQLLAGLAPKVLFQPAKWLLGHLGHIATGNTCGSIVAQREYVVNNVAGAHGIGEWNPVVLGYDVPKASRTITDGTTILPVLKAVKPLSLSERCVHLSFSCTTLAFLKSLDLRVLKPVLLLLGLSLCQVSKAIVLNMILVLMMPLSCFLSVKFWVVPVRGAILCASAFNGLVVPTGTPLSAVLRSFILVRCFVTYVVLVSTRLTSSSFATEVFRGVWKPIKALVASLLTVLYQWPSQGRFAVTVFAARHKAILMGASNMEKLRCCLLYLATFATAFKPWRQWQWRSEAELTPRRQPVSFLDMPMKVFCASRKPRTVGVNARFSAVAATQGAICGIMDLHGDLLSRYATPRAVCSSASAFACPIIPHSPYQVNASREAAAAYLAANAAEWEPGEVPDG